MASIRSTTLVLLSACLLGAAPAAMAEEAATATATPKTIAFNVGGGDNPSSERLTLGLNKAAVIELPADAADVLVSNPTIVDAVVRTPRRVYILGMATGQTNAFFFGPDGHQLLNLEIRVERDSVDLQNVITETLPDSDIDVEVVNDNVVLHGTADSALEAEAARDVAGRFVGDQAKVVDMVGITGSEQVMLKVRVAEMQRTVLKQLGIDISALLDAGEVPLRFVNNNQFSLFGQALAASNLLQVGNLTQGNDVQGVFRAMERAGLVKTLAEPNLTAISGEPAKFLAGGEFPVPTSRDREGNVLITFKPFGVGLGFTPVVLGKGRISLRVSTEVSELTTDGAFVSQGTSLVDGNGEVVTVPGVTIPSLRVRRAETTVELPSGGSIVMAGLIQESTKQNIDGLPGIKELPVLGQLFRSRDFQNSETELVVIVTPYLVKPTSQDQIALPTDGFAPASDLETIFLGNLNTIYGGSTGTGSQMQGPIGFIIE
jgi:pilus assembly protein CpaC